MAGKKKLTIGDVAERLGIKKVTWRSYVSRGQAPKPDGWDLPAPGTASAVPWWWEKTINEYERGRVGTGRVDGRYKSG